MSDTTPIATTEGETAPAPTYHIRIADPKDLEYYEDFTTPDWRHELADRLRMVRDDLSAIRFVRFALLVLPVFIVNHLVRHYLHGWPGWLLSLIMLAVVTLPVLQFRDLMKPLRQFTSPVRIARFFEIMYKSEDRKKIFWANDVIAEAALRDLFNLNIPTRVTDKGKVKPLKGGVDPYPTTVHVPGNTAILRRLAWTAINLMLVTLILGGGTLHDIAITMLCTAAIILVSLYRHAAMQPIHKLINADAKTDEAHDATPSTEDAEEDDTDTSDTLTTPVDDEITAVLNLLRRNDAKELLTAEEMTQLFSWFGNDIPTAEEFQKDLDSTTPADTTPLPTVAPAPVPAPPTAVLSAPVPAAPAPAPVAPPVAPAPADDDVPPLHIRNLLSFYHDGWPLTPDDEVLIQPYLKHRK